MKPSIIALLLMAAVATTGCGPLLGHRNDGKWTMVSSSDPDSVEARRYLGDLEQRSLGEDMRNEADMGADVETAAKSATPQATTEMQAFVDMLDRLESAGGLTKAQRDSLWSEMAATKPELRKPFLQSLTATLNYRLQKLERTDGTRLAAKEATQDQSRPPKQANQPPVTTPPVATQQATVQPVTTQPVTTHPGANQPVSTSEPSTSGLVFAPPKTPQRNTSSAPRPSPSVARLSQPPWTPKAESRDAPPSTRYPAREIFRPSTNVPFVPWRDKSAAWANRAPSTNWRDRVEQTAYHAPARDDRRSPAIQDHWDYRWQDHVLAAVDALEHERRSAPNEKFEMATETRLRLLYLAAGQQKEALADLPRNRAMATPERRAHQEFLQSALGGLDTYINHDLDKTEPVEANLAKVSGKFRQAADHVGKLSKLTIKNVALCQSADFGMVKPFAIKTFHNQQEVLIYAEVENFVSRLEQKHGKNLTYHTELKSRYWVFDSDQRTVGEGTLFKTIKDECSNYRRDFFISYRIRLPDKLYDGTHTLKLRVEDVLGDKFSEVFVDFEVVNGKNAK